MALSEHVPGGWQEPDAKGRKLLHSRFNLKWFRELDFAPSVIFDIGSFDAGDALRFKHLFPNATVVAADADPIRAAAIRRNVKGEDITVIEAAVIDRIGTIGLHHAGDRSELGSKCASIYQWPQKPLQELVTVRTTTLKAICDGLALPTIDFLHIDIEGAELLAIRGMADIRPTLIWAEVVDNGWVGAAGADATHDHIISLGYQQIATSKSDRLYIHG